MKTAALIVLAYVLFQTFVADTVVFTWQERFGTWWADISAATEAQQ